MLVDRQGMQPLPSAALAKAPHCLALGTLALMWTTWTFWVDLGTAVGGIATAVLAVFAITGGSAGLKDWRAKVRADKALADEEAYNLRLERQRLMQGWTAGMVNVYSVEPVTDRADMDRARDELIANEGSEYAILRVKEGVNRGHFLRELIRQGEIARPPTVAELDALNRWRASQQPGGQWVEPPSALTEPAKRAWWSIRRHRILSHERPSR